MIQNYSKIAIRNILRNKVFSFINTVGLAVGIAVVALIMLYVQFEWGYDRFYPNSDRIYRVIERLPGNIYMGNDYYAITPEPLGRAMQAEFPEVESYVTLKQWPDDIVSVGKQKRFREDILYATAPNFFDIFSYHFIRGSAKTTLSQLNTAVLSEDVARKFFGTQDPIGKAIKVRENPVWTITGVFKPLPMNSQFSSFGVITSFDTYVSTAGDIKDAFQWGNSSWYTYLFLKKESSGSALHAMFPSFVRKYIPPSEWSGKEPPQLFLQPLTDIHLFNHTAFDMAKNGDINVVLILIALALVILAVACINYMNLATARASSRAREVGVRKVIGAKRRQLIVQFIGESLILTTFAGMLGLVLDEIFLRSFSNLLDIDFGHESLLQPAFLAGFLLLVVIVGLLSGAYPAFALSLFQPARVLKGDQRKRDRLSLRHALVVGQFAASIALITCTLIILSQMKFIRTRSMGYNRENVVVVPLNDQGVQDHSNTVEQQLKEYPAIVNVTTCSDLPIDVTSETDIHVPHETGNSTVSAYFIYVGYDFLKTFHIPIVEGRAFSPLVPTDSSEAIIINQSFERVLGWKHAVGKTLLRGTRYYKIVGIMKDFNLHSLRHKIQPLFIQPFPRVWYWPPNLCIRIRSNNIPAAMSYIKSVWDSFSIERPFDYTFLDADFNAMYKSEEQMSEIVSYSSGLAIMIACLGLFGLVSFSVERRRKEIGVRKVLGASVSDVARLMTCQFLGLVVFGNVIAWPVAYYLMHGWLSGFAYGVNLELWPFVLASVAALVIAVTATSSLAIKAATANPVEALRYE